MKSEDKINNLREELMEKIDNLAKNVEDVKICLAELPDKIFERADKRYASKLSEKIIYGMVGVITTGVVVALLALVMK